MVRGKRAPSPRGARSVVLEEESDPVERILEKVEPHPPRSPKKQADLAPAVRVARLVSVAGAKIEIAFRGPHAPIEAKLGEGVERELVAQALKNRDAVLVEVDADAAPVIVGVVQTRIPRELVLKAETVHIEAERELLLRSKTAAIRLRE